MARNKKHAFIIGYNGLHFHGCQINNDINTVEKVFVEGLVECNAIKATTALDPSKIGLQRCSRTDAGVHALMNVFVAKTSVVPEFFFDELKDFLFAKNLMLYKICRLPKSFTAQRKCDYRIYEYHIPTYLFQESNYADDKSNLEPLLGDINVSLKPNGDKVLENKPNPDELISKLKNILKIESFRLSGTLLVEIMNNFQKYVGTRNYTNFTSANNDKGTSRHIKSIFVDEPVVVDGIEYLRVIISGQSFLYNQIRNMIAYVVEYIRYKSIKDFEEAFDPSSDVQIFKAPSQFLLLSEIIFENHNADLPEDQKLEVPKCELEGFKESMICRDIFCDINILWTSRWVNTMCSYTSRG